MKRLTRTLVYVGPDDWIEGCLEKREVKGDSSIHWLTPPRTIIEVSAIVEDLPTHLWPQIKENSK